MFFKIISILSLAGCLFCGEAHATAGEKLLALKRVNSIAQKLLVIAQQRQELSQRGIETFNDADIKGLVQTQKDIDVLYRLAAVSRSYEMPGHAEDHIIDDVFNTTWTLCVHRIEKIGGPKAIRALENIPLDYIVDGAASLEIREALDRLKGHDPQ